MQSAKCTVCLKKISRNTQNFHFCPKCEGRSHAKCLGVEPKYVRNIWLCKLCRHDALPNFESDEKLPIGKDISHLKNYFKHLNSISNSFSNFDSQIDDQLDDITYDDHINHFDCKYYSTQEFASLPHKKQNFSCFHLNICSLEKHHDNLTTLLYNLNHNFSILGISETRLKSSIENTELSINGFKSFDTPAVSSVGGTALFISNSLKSKPRKDLSRIVHSDCGNLESTFAEIVLKNRKNFIVGCIYKHPLLDVDLFNQKFLSPLLKKACQENKNLILLGDFNIDLLTCDSVISHSKFLDILGAYQILPTITLPTRITDTSSTLIDNILTSPLNCSSISGNLTVAISDHLPQFLILNSDCDSDYKSELPFRRDWSKFDEATFKDEFDSVDWKDLLKTERGNVDLSFDSFLTRFSSLYDKHVPLKQLTRRQANLLLKPWITKGIRVSMNIRDSLKDDYLKVPNSSPDLKNFLRDRYKFYRNRIVSLIRASKKLYYSRYFFQNSGNLRKLWQGVREIISSPSSSNSISLNINDSLSSNPEEVSEAFNDFFSTIAGKIRSKIPFTRHHFSEWLKNENRNANHFLIAPASKAELSKALTNLSENTATGPNSIPYRIISSNLDSLSSIFTDIINLSFFTGVFPSQLKEAKVIPVFKNKGSPFDAENYRPISLLSNIDKIFQKLMHSRLINFLDQSNSIYPLQFGFRSNHSTETALLYSINKISNALDEGKYGCSIFIDLQKAFDTVDHSILLSKLNFYGVRGKALDWFRSFLTDRSQFVSVSGKISSSKHMQHGVPQGSVLGPLLFLLYVNDLHIALRYSLVNLFADDTMLFFENESLKPIAKQANIDLKLLMNWLKANKISINASKTELLLFRPVRKKIDYDLKIKINGHRLRPSKFVKYLGVYIDEHLNWKHHIDFVCNKLKRANGALSKLRHYVDKKTLTSLYFSLFQCHISYAAQIWGERQTIHARRVLILHKQALRIMSFSDFRAHTFPLFLEFKLLQFFDFVKYLNIIFVFKLFNRKLPLPLLQTLEYKRLNDTDRHEVIRCKSGLLKIPEVTTVTYGNYSILYQSILVWNELQNFVSLDDLSTLALDRLKDLSKLYFLSSYT